ncbi:MAG: ATPase domain-containing protein [Candidatus Altiarchaeota archaeon]
MDDKCPTGIPGFDELVGGGLPRGRSILLSGSCGTGKTTFAIQFLANGIEKYDEPGILVTLEQHSDELRSDALKYGIDLKKYEEQKRLIIIDTSLSRIGMQEFIAQIPEVPDNSFSLLPDEFEINKIIDITSQAAQKIGAKRIVVDSLPALDYLIQEQHDLRRALINMNYELKSKGLTALIITEALEEDGISKHGVEEYISDGVIILRTNEALDTRTLKIRKMRTIKHTLKPNTFELTQNGITVGSGKGI